MTLTQVLQKAGEIGKPLFCIARFLQTQEPSHVFYQIIVDPEKVTRSGKFICFDQPTGGVYGFKPIDSMNVHEILGAVSVNDKGETSVEPLEPEVRKVA